MRFREGSMAVLLGAWLTLPSVQAEDEELGWPEAPAPKGVLVALLPGASDDRGVAAATNPAEAAEPAARFAAAPPGTGPQAVGFGLPPVHPVEGSLDGNLPPELPPEPPWMQQASVAEEPLTPIAWDEPTCDDCGECYADCCCLHCTIGLYVHRNTIFVEGLAIRPSNADVVFAVEQTDPDPTVANPTGPVGIANIDFDGGLRAGFVRALSDCSSVMARYSWFDSGARASIDATPGNVLDSRIIHPSTLTSGAASLSATAAYDLRFQRVDVDYQRLLWGTCDFALNFSGGLRYGTLEQQLLAEQPIAVATGITTVTTDIDFDGFGIGLGLDAQRRHAPSGLLIYGQTGASFLEGEFKADFRQTNQLGGGVIGNTLEDYRLVSILELELGLGWQNACGNFRVTTGYLASGWFNTVTTDQYIQGFRSGDLTDLSEALSFSGLTLRAELRY